MIVLFSDFFSGGIHTVARRRESFARIHSMTIEAPITKVSDWCQSLFFGVQEFILA